MPDPFGLNDEQLSTTGDQLASELPEPQQHAIDEAQRETAAAGGNGAGTIEVDVLGVPWNPEQHATGADGKGVKTQRGTWRKRRGVTGSASVLGNAGKPEATPVAPDPAIQQRQAMELECRQGGMVAAHMLIGISIGVGGEDFIPGVLQGPGGVSVNEQEWLEKSFGDYFVAKGIVDLPPGWALASALSMYYLRRLTMKRTQERAKGFFAWCKAKWASWRLRKHGLRVVPKGDKPIPPSQAADPDPGVRADDE